MIASKYAKERLIESIERIVKEKEKFVVNPNKDFTRNRKLPLKKLIFLIISMGNSTLQKELSKYCNINKVSITSSAVVQSRKKIRAEGFRYLMEIFTKSLYTPKTYKGYALYAIDGSKINIAHNPNSADTYIDEKCARGYNQVHLTGLYDLLNDTFIDGIVTPVRKANERKTLCDIVNSRHFSRKTIIVGDRGFEGFHTFATMIEKSNVEFVIRVKHSGGEMRELRELPMKELDTRITPVVTTTQTKEDKALKRHWIQVAKEGKKYSDKTHRGVWDFPSPYPMSLRVVRFKISENTYETLVTTLNEDQFSISDLKDIYHKRWGIETAFRHLKYPCGVSFLHSRIEEFAHQEIYAALILHNLAHFLASAAVVQKKSGAKYEYKVNFSMCVAICRRRLQNKFNINGIIEEIGRYTTPIRPNRSDKRKIEYKKFVCFMYRAA